MSGSRAHGLQDRKHRRAGVKKTALTSRTSLLSSLTASSGGSSGSGSTITQEPVPRSQARINKEYAAPGRERDLRGSANDVPGAGHNSAKRTMDRIDVFQFLANDQSRASLVEQRHKKATEAQKGAKAALRDDSDLDSGTRSLHSDSGVSLSYTSSDHEPSKGAKLLDEARRGDGRDTQAQISSKTRSWRGSRRTNPHTQGAFRDSQEQPEDWYKRSSVEPIELSAPSPLVSGPEAEPGTTDDSSGYNLLAGHLSAQKSQEGEALPPLYRRFERLNHRILLQLQDEIAEMEADLHHLDHIDAWHRASQYGGPVPASRRFDRQWVGNDLHGRRLEVLGRIYLKVEQYNQALASFQRVITTTSLVADEDLDRYRRWMELHRPIVDSETMYLDQKDDLINLSPAKPGASPFNSSTNQLTSLLTALVLASTIPILVFRILPTLLSRICLILLLLGPLVVLVSKHRGKLPISTPPEMEQLLPVYSAILLFAALVV